MKTSWVSVAVVVLLLVAGCRGGGVASPSPSVGTSVAVSSATPNGDADVAEAMSTYERIREVWWQIATVDGGLGPDENPPLELTTLMAGEDLDDTLAGLRKWRTGHYQVTSGHYKIVWMEPREGLGYRDSIVTLQACDDDRDVHVTHDGGSYVGRAVVTTLFFSRQADGTLKSIYSSTEFGWEGTCGDLVPSVSPSS